MKKISALEVFTKAFYFTFSSFDLIFLIFIITGIANIISLIILNLYSFLYEGVATFDETNLTSITPISQTTEERDTVKYLIISIGVVIFLILVLTLSAIIAYLYVFSKKGKKINLLKIVYNAKDYYVGFLILGLITHSVFIILLVPFLILFLVPLYGNLAVLSIILFFILLAIALYIHLRLSLSLPIYFKRKNVKESLKESWKLMKGNVFKLFLILVLITLMSFGFGFVEMLILSSFSFYYLENPFAFNVTFSIISSFFGSIITVLSISAHTFFYLKLKGKK